MSAKRGRGSRFHAALNGARWQRVRWAVLQRDRFRCQKCGKAGRLEVHHRQALEDGGAPFDPANLEAFCRGCHIQHHRAQALAGRPQAAAWRRAVDELL